MHDNDLIHLDVKPENILLSMDGVCKLGDFGLVVNLKEVIFITQMNFATHSKMFIRSGLALSFTCYSFIS